MKNNNAKNTELVSTVFIIGGIFFAIKMMESVTVWLGEYLGDPSFVDNILAWFAVGLPLVAVVAIWIEQRIIHRVKK